MTAKKPEPADAADRRVGFQQRAIRRAWHNAEWWFAIVDVVAVLTTSVQPESYVKDLRRRDKELAEGRPESACTRWRCAANSPTNGRRAGCRRATRTRSSPPKTPAATFDVIPGAHKQRKGLGKV